MMWVSGLAKQEEKANFGTVHSSAPSLPRQAEVKAEEPEMCWATETLIFPGCFDNLQISWWFAVHIFMQLLALEAGGSGLDKGGPNPPNEYLAP